LGEPPNRTPQRGVLPKDEIHKLTLPDQIGFPSKNETAVNSADIFFKLDSFSLIELLVVIAIMAIIIAMAIPAYNSITRGSAVSSGITQFTASVAAARQRAVTKRSYTAIVFSYDNGSGVYTTNETAQYAVSYTTMARITNSWYYVDQWRHLPKGAFFSTVPSSTVDMPFPTNGGAIITGIPAIVFKTWGVPTAPCTFEVKEGAMRPGGTTLINSNAYNFISGAVYRVTGSIKIFK